jgi:hypothetical protein
MSARESPMALENHVVIFVIKGGMTFNPSGSLRLLSINKYWLVEGHIKMQVNIIIHIGHCEVVGHGYVSSGSLMNINGIINH